jgi:predicted phage-related endonuclease
MTTPKLTDDSALSINIKWLIQIVALVGSAVYMYLQLENRVKEVEDEVKGIRYNQNTYVFPDIRILEGEVLNFKLEKERVRKDITRINEKINELD